MSDLSDLIAYSPAVAAARREGIRIEVVGEPVRVKAEMTVSDEEKAGTTFYAPPAVGTESHDEWIEWYRTAEYEDRNAVTRDIAVLQHDFEVRFNTDHDGPDVTGVTVALLVQMDRLSGEYDPTANERLVHDWHITEPTSGTSRTDCTCRT